VQPVDEGGGEELQGKLAAELVLRRVLLQVIADGQFVFIFNRVSLQPGYIGLNSACLK